MSKGKNTNTMKKSLQTKPSQYEDNYNITYESEQLKDYFGKLFEKYEINSKESNNKVIQLQDKYEKDINKYEKDNEYLKAKNRVLEIKSTNKNPLCEKAVIQNLKTTIRFKESEIEEYKVVVQQKNKRIETLETEIKNLKRRKLK
jgi:phage shock protein A